MTFIAEMGSGNTCRNDFGLVSAMIDAVVEQDTGKHNVVFKWQLFHDMPPNEKLDWSVFTEAYEYAEGHGYQTTASVFNEECLQFLLEFDVPFVKLPCVRELYPLAKKVPADISVVVSYPNATRVADAKRNERIIPLCCVREYPADIVKYRAMFDKEQLQYGISDHTEGWGMYHAYQPEWLEKHIVLERDEDNPDAGPFAVTPDELEGVL